MDQPGHDENEPPERQTGRSPGDVIGLVLLVVGLVAGLIVIIIVAQALSG